MASIFDPVDPPAVSDGDLKRRVGVFFAAMERGDLPCPPLPPGWFRCFTCRREFPKAVPEAEALEEYRRRFAGEPDPEPDTPFIVCDYCNTVIAEDQGVPL